MKIRLSLLLGFIGFTLTASLFRAAADTGSLFNSNEFQYSVELQSANGNVDVQPQQHTTYTSQTTTTHTEVEAPTVPSPSPTPPIDEDRRAAVKKAAAKGGGEHLVDPIVKTTTTTRHIVKTHRTEHNAFGGGVRVSWFFTRYLGIAADGDFLGGNPYNTSVIGALIFRYPFEFGASQTTSGYAKDGKDGKTVETGPTWGLAPYIIAGGGGQWDGRGVGIGTVGGGVEFRFRKHWGIFAEGRWVVHDSHQNYAAETLGLDFSY